MATAKRKTMPKPVAKRPVKHVTTAERMRLATKPSRSTKPTEQRMREATHAIRPTTPKKESPPMMTAEEETRGAGTGGNAIQQRSRPAGDTKTPLRKNAKPDEDDVKERMKKEMAEAVKNNQAAADESEGEGDDDAPEPPEDVTEYPEGDPDKGAIDPENPTRPIAHRDRRAYLVRQGERNQAANDQLNAMQVAQNKRVGEVSAYLQDPDYMRETSMQTAITALKAHDPDVVQAKHEEMAKRMKAKQEKEDKKNGTK